MDMSYLFNRCNVIANQYFEGSIKKRTREDHGSGTGFIVTFDDCSDILPNFISKFLNNVTHKTTLNKYLANNFFSKLFTQKEKSNQKTYNSALLDT